MFTPTFALQLTAAERAELDAMTRATRIPAGLARRARLILALAAGTPYDTITGALGFAPSSISRWKRRFHRARVMGLRDAPRGGRNPVRPLSPGRAERHGFEYVRHGALSLYAALEVGTGHVEGRTVARHSSVEFLAFLDQLVAAHPRRRAIHLIADNFAAHKTKAVAAWLAAHPRVALHFTPTSSSWLNQIELWFAKIERDCLARGIFTSTADLRRKLMQYIRAHNKTCRPFRWAYTNPKHRIRAIGKRETVH